MVGAYCSGITSSALTIIWFLDIRHAFGITLTYLLYKFRGLDFLFSMVIDGYKLSFEKIWTFGTARNIIGFDKIEKNWKETIELIW